MDAWPETGPKSACDDARLRASLALDGLTDDLGLHLLRSHLDACPACRRFVAETRSTVALLRGAPLETCRRELTTSWMLRSCSSGRGRHWAGAAVAVVALVLATASLPSADGVPDRLDRAAASQGGYRYHVTPLRVPIGQRSAVDEFAAVAPADPYGLGPDRTQ